jgi:hypothetical protein
MQYRHNPLCELGNWFKKVLTGYYKYFDIPGNRTGLQMLRTEVAQAWICAYALIYVTKTKLNQGYTTIDNEQPKKVFLQFIMMGVFMISGSSIFLFIIWYIKNIKNIKNTIALMFDVITLVRAISIDYFGL